MSSSKKSTITTLLPINGLLLPNHLLPHYHLGQTLNQVSTDWVKARKTSLYFGGQGFLVTRQAGLVAVWALLFLIAYRFLFPYSFSSDPADKEFEQAKRKQEEQRNKTWCRRIFCCFTPCFRCCDMLSCENFKTFLCGSLKKILLSCVVFAYVGSSYWFLQEVIFGAIIDVYPEKLYFARDITKALQKYLGTPGESVKPGEPLASGSTAELAGNAALGSFRLAALKDAKGNVKGNFMDQSTLKVTINAFTPYY